MVFVFFSFLLFHFLLPVPLDRALDLALELFLFFSPSFL